MADQKRWFKLWCSAPGDDFIQALPPEIRWAWAAFGAHTKLHGTRGRIIVSASNRVLAAEMGIPLESLFNTIRTLPHVQIDLTQSANDRLAVTWQNWQKYQEDSTIAERVSRLRSKRRGEEKRVPPVVPQGTENGFDQFWRAYPRKEGKGKAEEAWRKHAKAVPVGRILEGVEKWRGSRSWAEGFVAMPATWLNQKRWLDDPQPASGQNADLPEARQCGACGGIHSWHGGQRLELCPREANP